MWFYHYLYLFLRLNLYSKYFTTMYKVLLELGLRIWFSWGFASRAQNQISEIKTRISWRLFRVEAQRDVTRKVFAIHWESRRDVTWIRFNLWFSWANSTWRDEKSFRSFCGKFDVKLDNNFHPPQQRPLSTKSSIVTYLSVLPLALLNQNTTRP